MNAVSTKVLYNPNRYFTQKSEKLTQGHLNNKRRLSSHRNTIHVNVIKESGSGINNVLAIEDNRGSLIYQAILLFVLLLSQGGAFYFLEHVVSGPSTWTCFFQHVFEPLWYYLCDGCVPTRTTWRDLESAGFSQLHLRHIEAPEVSFLLKPHIMGYCIK